MPLELVVGDIHLVAEEEVELGDGGQVEEDAVGNEADVILSTLMARLQSWIINNLTWVQNI